MGRILDSSVIRLPADNDKRAVVIVTVLVAGQVGDYAAYRAAVMGGRYDSESHDEFAAREGNKLMYEEALRHFPYIEHEKYRD